MISYGKQFIDQSDIDAVVEVLKGDWLTQGPAVDNFENDLKNYFGCKHCCVVSSGSAALHLIGLALGWQPGDVVITTSITFLATANCIVYAGATPDFVDIDPNNYTIAPYLVENQIKRYFSKGKKVKAIIGVDYAGHPCDWKALRTISNKYDIQLINDNCHALGASYFGDKQYASKYADVVIQSFHPVKHITTGEGGAVLTNDPRIDEKVRLLKSHGVIRGPLKVENNEGPWYYEMHELGYNYRITDFQCVLGSRQLDKIDQFLEKRSEIARKYDEAFSTNNALKIPESDDYAEHAYHLYPLQIDFAELKLAKSKFFEIMKQNGINLQVHYMPVYLHPFYKRNYGFSSGYCLIAENFYELAVSIPLYPSLTDTEVERVVTNILGFVESK